MTGISEIAHWEQDGMYLSMKAGEDITLGTVVELSSTVGEVDVAGDASTKPLGVAIAGYRTSRIATDNQVAEGNLVTVATRGVVNVECTGTVTVGQLVQTDTGGKVKTLTIGAHADENKALGLALSTATDGLVKVKLLRG